MSIPRLGQAQIPCIHRSWGIPSEEFKEKFSISLEKKEEVKRARDYEFHSIQLLITAQNLALYLLGPEVGSIALALERAEAEGDMAWKKIDKAIDKAYFAKLKAQKTSAPMDTSKRKRVMPEMDVESFLDSCIGAAIDKEREEREGQRG